MFWLVLMKLGLVLVGVVLVSIRLVAAKRLVWFGLFIVAVIAGFWGTNELSRQAAQMFSDGRGNEIVLLRVVGLATDLLA
ncbi:MAG: hypothetical protein ABI459_04630, partial [Deltaproteobacteria bacterium]